MMTRAQKMSDRMPRTLAGVGGRVHPVEALPHRVERARADVAVDDPQGAQGEEGEPLAVRVLGVAPFGFALTL